MRPNVIELQQHGEPKLEQPPEEGAEDQVQDQVPPQPGEPSLTEVAAPGWTPEQAMGLAASLWNVMALYYGMDYVAEQAEIAPMAPALVQFLDAFVPPPGPGSPGGLVVAGAHVAAVGASMWQNPKRIAARKHPTGMLAGKKESGTENGSTSRGTSRPAGSGAQPEGGASNRGTSAASSEKGFHFTDQDQMVMNQHAQTRSLTGLEGLGIDL